MTDDDLKRLKDLADRATRPQWFARGRFISLVPDNSGMGAMLHTNHIANFAERDDAEFVAAARSAVPDLLAEVERLTAERDAAARNALAETIVSVKHEREANDAIALVVGERDAARAEVARLTAALVKISAIRDSIVGMQGFNFSEHAYPLVAALDEAGFKGAGYEIARANLGTLIEQRNRAEAERDALRLSPEECEALRTARQLVGGAGFKWRHQMSDPIVAKHVDDCRAALAALDKVLAANGGE